MSGNRRVDNKGRVLRNGEMQRKQDGRYLYRYIDLSGSMEERHRGDRLRKYENCKDKAISYPGVLFLACEKGICGEYNQAVSQSDIPSLRTGGRFGHYQEEPGKDCKKG